MLLSLPFHNKGKSNDTLVSLLFYGIFGLTIIIGSSDRLGGCVGGGEV